MQPKKISLQKAIELHQLVLKLTVQPKILMVHVLGFTETRPPLPDCAQLLTNMGHDLLHNGISSIMLHNTWPEPNGCLTHHYLKLLVWGAATRAARALDSHGWLAFCVTHFQKRGEHAPPKHTHARTQIVHAASLTRFAEPGCIKSTSRLLHSNFTGWCRRGRGHIFSCNDCTNKLVVIGSFVAEKNKLGHSLFEHDREYTEQASG